MKTVIFSVTRNGALLAQKLKQQLPEAKAYAMDKFHAEGGVTLPMEKPLKVLVEESFYAAELIIFIMATGIAVRLIAPLLQDKKRDPAVLVLDDKGNHMISLLSGHVGGANFWAKRLGEAIGARPIITTASDINGLLSIDMLAMENNCSLQAWEAAKEITAYMVDGGYVGIYSETEEALSAPQAYKRVNSLEALSAYTYGVYVSNRELGPMEKGLIQLYPRNIVVGVGCKAATAAEAIQRAIQSALQQAGVSIYSIQKLVTIDIKAREAGLLATAESLKVPLEIVSPQEIRKVEGLFKSSAFVKEAVGVTAVSGPCAYIGSNGGRLLLEKWKGDGVTISLAEIKSGVKENE